MSDSTQPSGRFLGETSVDLNAIVRGEIDIKPGDTFLNASIDMHGWIACCYLPNWRTGHGGWNNFKVLAQGTRTTCLAAAKQGVGQ